MIAPEFFEIVHDHRVDGFLSKLQNFWLGMIAPEFLEIQTFSPFSKWQHIGGKIR
jgi:hypothetical protein